MAAPLPPELTAVPRPLPAGQYPRLSIALAVIFTVGPFLIGTAAVLQARERGTVGNGPGLPGVIRDVRIEKTTGKHASAEAWRATVVYTDANGAGRREDIDLPEDVARDLPAEKQTVVWTWHDYIHGVDVPVTREGLDAAQEKAHDKLVVAGLVQGFFALVALIVFLVPVRRLRRRVHLLTRGEIVEGRITGAGWRSRVRAPSIFLASYVAQIPEGEIRGSDRVSNRQISRLGRQPQAQDRAFIVYDRLDPNRHALWGVGKV